MHAAPPVRMILGPDPAWVAFGAACLACAVANLIAWGALTFQTPMAIIAVVALLVPGLASCWAWRGAPTQGVLAWDGSTWRWAPAASAPTPGGVRVMIDLGGWMLLRFVPDATPRRAVWLAVSRRQGGALWSSWRAALFSHRPDVDPAVHGDRS